jgi:hypothetical protein
MKYEYRYLELTSIEAIKRAEDLKAQGWKVFTHGLDSIGFERVKLNSKERE